MIRKIVFNWFIVFIPTIIYLILVHSLLLKIELYLGNFAALSMLFIFTVSVLIMNIGSDTKPESFVFRYLTMTTVQMLSFLAIVTAFIFTKKPTIIVFHSLALFGVLLVFQSAGLLLFKKKE